MDGHRLASSLALVCTFASLASALPVQVTPERAFLGQKPTQTVVSPDHHPTTLEVKFVHGAKVRLADGKFRSPEAAIQRVDALLDEAQAVRSRLFQQTDSWLENWVARGEERSGRPLHDLTLFYRIELPQPGQVGALCDQLNASPLVELAYPIARVADPVWCGPTPTAPAGTPNFESQQGYRGPAPTGIDADYGNTFYGGKGRHTTIVDVETGWTDDHEDIAHKALGNFIGLTPAPYPWDHGTAVLGELVGERNGFGVEGICYEADVLMSSHLGFSSNIPTAIANAAAAADEDSVIVLEVQCFGGAPDPYPCEFQASIYATVAAATANGVHVFAAAGNGNNDLDGASYGGLFDRNVRDSGAVIVGASDGSSLNKASFSNYGSRVDVHGWGRDVTTTAYGDLFGNTPINEYTDSFSGTSSATPIVTGAGIIVNGIWRYFTETNLDPLELRAILADTGTPQGAGGNIGPRPNVRAAIQVLEIPRITAVSSGPYDPDMVALAASPGDTGSVWFAPDLRDDPLVIEPFGAILLGQEPVLLGSGTFGPSGELHIPLLLRKTPGAQGRMLGWVQGLVRSVETRATAPDQRHAASPVSSSLALKPGAVSRHS